MNKTEFINLTYNTETDLTESDISEDLIQSIKYVGPLAYYIGWDVHKTIEALSYFEKVNIKGAVAGTSLRFILMRLADLDKGLAIKYLDVYSIFDFEVDPRYNTFPEILNVFSSRNVSEDHIYKIFGRTGEAFWELMKAHEVVK